MKIKAAIIGMGIGQKHFEAIEGYKGSKVDIICEKDKKKNSQLKKKYPKKKIVSNENEIFENKEINLVSIASYDDSHFRQIIKSIKKKKHIIIEKPMCLKKNELKKINILLKKNPKIKIISNLVLRTNDLFMNFKKDIDIKKVLYIEADYLWGRKYKLSEWRSKIKDYSITLGAGIHMFDLIMWFLKLRPISVQAFGTKKGNTGTTFKKVSLAVYILNFPNNIIVKITANAAAVFNHFHEVKIYQQDKTLINSRTGAFSLIQSKNDQKLKKLNFRYPDKKNRKKLIQNFIDSLKKNKVKQIMTSKEQIDLMTVCFAADESLKFGKKVMIRYL
jgi:predicted dehydrogenase